MSGATARHSLIAGTIFTRLFTAADEGSCRVFTSDMRLEAAGDKYYYPSTDSGALPRYRPDAPCDLPASRAAGGQ